MLVEKITIKYISSRGAKCFAGNCDLISAYGKRPPEHQVGQGLFLEVSLFQTNECLIDFILC